MRTSGLCQRGSASKGDGTCMRKRVKQSKKRRQYEAFLQKGICPVCQWQSKRVTAVGRQHDLENHLSDERLERDDVDAMIDQVVSQQTV
jgi:hypothetical protein